MSYHISITSDTYPLGVRARLSYAATFGISEGLRAFVEEMPHERRSILAFVRGVAESLPPGAVVLDVGAGDAPYRELFEHCDYRTSDWEHSLHEGARGADYIASADTLPLESATVDAVLMTQVLEHVQDPPAVLREAARVLRQRGGIFLTVPFVWELHELPYDYWRFTPASLECLLAGAGFTGVEVEARNDCFQTAAQMLRNVKHAMGRAADGRDAEREAVGALLDQIAERIAGLGELDAAGILPLGWAASARRS